MPSHLSIVTQTVTDLPAGTCEPLTVRADPSCLAFDQLTQALYVADAYGGAIVRVVGESVNTTQRRIGTVDSGGVVATNRIGGIALAADGIVFATRIGYGQAGAILRLRDGHAEALPRVPARPWRGGIAHADGVLYTTQYLRSSSGPFDGSIVEVDATTGSCSTVIDGFLHPTGIVKLGPMLVVADARQRAVFRIGLAGGRGVHRFQLASEIDRPDSLCACGDDSVLVTSYCDMTGRGSVHRVWLDGHSRLIAQGSWEPRGIACDGERIFVATRRTGRVLVFSLYF